MLIVDAQVHIWGADTPDRPWPPGRAAQAQKPYPVTKDLVLEGMKEAGVDRVVSCRPHGKATAMTGRSRRRAFIPIDSR